MPFGCAVQRVDRAAADYSSPTLIQVLVRKISELRVLRRLQGEQSRPSIFIFTSERGSPFSTAGFYKLVARAGAVASLGIKVHPHMLRHATGFDLANRGTDTRTLQDYLGHRNIQHTVRYTELTPHRFKDLWSD